MRRSISNKARNSPSRLRGGGGRHAAHWRRQSILKATTTLPASGNLERA